MAEVPGGIRPFRNPKDWTFLGYTREYLETQYLTSYLMCNYAWRAYQKLISEGNPVPVSLVTEVKPLILRKAAELPPEQLSGLSPELQEAVDIYYATNPVPDEDVSVISVSEENSSVMREFGSGATRSSDDGKLQYAQILSPAVLRSYAEYMLANAKQADGSVRPGNNWKKGIPSDSYMDSMWRHFMDVWMIEEGRAPLSNPDVKLEEALCALLFNVMGRLDNYLLAEPEKRHPQGPARFSSTGGVWRADLGGQGSSGGVSYGSSWSGGGGGASSQALVDMAVAKTFDPDGREVEGKPLTDALVRDAVNEARQRGD